MKKILHIISSPRGTASNSIKLGKAIVERIQLVFPGSSITEVDLVSQQFPHLEESHLISFFTPAEKRTPENIAAIHHSDEAINQLKEADIIVIGAPLYNFTIHSTLKAWIDHIVRRNITFRADENESEGLLKGKKVYIAVSSGWIYTEGPLQQFDFVVPYLKHILGFIGLTDITIFRVEGSGVPGVRETALEKGIKSIRID